jgi:hypothetical protein
MEFVSNKYEKFGGFPHLRRMAIVRQKACTEGGWVLDIPTLGGCASGNWFETNRSLCGRVASDRRELYRQLADL